MKTTTQVKKWGNSLAIRIPQTVVQELGLSDDSQLQLSSDSTGITLVPKVIEEISLEKLIRKITPENIHGEVDWGHPVGKELW